MKLLLRSISIAAPIVQRSLLLAPGLLLLAFCLLPFGGSAQVTADPVFPTVNDNVTITFDATQGNGALVGVSPVYAHMGVITNLSSSPSDWKYVPTTWGIADPIGAMTNAGPNLWKKTFNIKTFFNIPAGEQVLKLAFVFRNTAGNIVGRASDGGDIFYPVYPDNGSLLTTFISPSASSLIQHIGDNIAVKAAASQTANLKLFDNGTQVATGNGKELQFTLPVATAGLHTVLFIASTANDSDTSTFLYVVPENLAPQDPPAGTPLGISFVDDQTVRLSLYAPNKAVVYAIGDFNDWLPGPAYQMRNSLDGNTWWIEIGGLTPGEIYRFQYFVDGALKIADPLSTLVLDPFNDGFIPPLSYPNLPAYPSGKTNGIVSVLQTAQQPFDWQTTNYTRPKKTDLVIYELLLRDFLDRHDYPTLLDTLDYLEKLGVTAIELMPVNEFDGNINWGYSPAFHKALDKYYGTADALKKVVDECHARGIAIILDVVYNHATGASPLAQLYWDAANNRPAADNPWLNPTATHDFNVYNDFNHESPATRAYVKNCLAYWLSEFHVDGFRFDLSKGFTQKVTIGDVAAWGAYDASRIAILKEYADLMWSIDPTSYVILEHFADNTEEKELANYGMMLWGNMSNAYRQVGLGTSSGISTSVGNASYKARGWTVPHLVGYMESHDEERIAYSLLNGGAASGNYDIKSFPTAMTRIEMLENLLYTVPGPKMLWQFGELGYEIPINYCEDGSIDNGCRTGPKPIRWFYLQDPYRRRLHDVTAALLNLRKSQDVFETTNYTATLGGGAIRSVALNGSPLSAFAIANVAITPQNAQVYFSVPGWWYDYYTGDSVQAIGGQPTSLALDPGEYRLYLTQKIAVPAGLDVTATREQDSPLAELSVFPNPASGSFTAQFFLRATAQVRVEVRDLTGRLVYSLPLGELPAGEQGIEVETEGWAPGVYALTLRDGRGGMAVRKVLKM